MAAAPATTITAARLSDEMLKKRMGFVPDLSESLLNTAGNMT
jgi:hypothetical protein